MANQNPSPSTRFGQPGGNKQSPGGWKPENTISYQYRRFLNMTPEELELFQNVPKSERTVAMDIAYSQVLQSRKSLPHAKEITDRTEGKSFQAMDITSNGKDVVIPILDLSDVLNNDSNPKD
jgi:hypothetical protein